MPNYRYKAKDIIGNVYTGVREAASEQEVVLWQKGYGHIVCNIQEAGSKLYTNALSPAALHEFCQELSIMLKSGIPVVKALTIMSTSKSSARKMVPLYKELISLLKRGLPLSEALRAQGEAFPDLIVNVVYSGEVSGNMGDVVKRLADYYEKDKAMKQKISGATAYPKFLGLLTVGIVILLFTFVLPSIFESGMFGEGQLPAITRFMMAVSGFMVRKWNVLLFGTAAFAVGVAAVTRQRPVKIWIHKALLELPKIGNLLKMIYTARFSITLSYLYASGVPVATAVSVASATVTNLYVRNQLTAAVERISQGMMISAAIQNLDCISPRLYHILAIGEETGKLNDVLASMSFVFDSEVDTAVTKLLAILSPMLLVIMSLIVVTVMLSVLLPIFSSYANMSGLI